MFWYLWQRGSFIPDYSIGKNEAFTKLRAKTLEEAKEELRLIVTEENIIDEWHYLDLTRTYKTNDYEYTVEEARLFYVEQEIDLGPDILAAQKKSKNCARNKKLKKKKKLAIKNILNYKQNLISNLNISYSPI